MLYLKCEITGQKAEICARMSARSSVRTLKRHLRAKYCYDNVYKWKYAISLLLDNYCSVFIEGQISKISSEFKTIEENLEVVELTW